MTSTNTPQLIARIAGNGSHGIGFYSLIQEPITGRFELGFFKTWDSPVVEIAAYGDYTAAIRGMDENTYYNATAHSFAYDGLEAVKVDSEGRVWRGCGSVNHLSGTPEYHNLWEKGIGMGEGYKIHRDNCEMYKAKIAFMGIAFK